MYNSQIDSHLRVLWMGLEEHGVVKLEPQIGKTHIQFHSGCKKEWIFMIQDLLERTPPLETPSPQHSSSSFLLHFTQSFVIQGGTTTHSARNPLQKRAPIFLIMARASIPLFHPSIHCLNRLRACFSVHPRHTSSTIFTSGW